MNGGRWAGGRGWHRGWRGGWGWGPGLALGLGGLYAYGGPYYCDPYNPWAYPYGYCGSYVYGW